MSLTPNQRKQARTLIRAYLEQSESNQPRIHYSQFRPLTSLGDPPSHGFTTDCSGLVISAFFAADRALPYLIKDPGGYAYSGWGFTGSLLATNKTRRVPANHRYFVGDIALYGRNFSATSHTVVCRRGGGMLDSVWTSHGSERGPYAVRLNYRSDLLVVVRSESLA